MSEEKIKQATNDFDTFLKEKMQGFGCIAFFIDKNADLDAFGVSQKVDFGDALVCIKKIVSEFEIDRQSLMEVLFEDLLMAG